VVAYVIGQAGSLLPVPGGLGGVEATLIGTLVVYGIALAPAAAAVLVYRAVSLSVPLALGVAAYIRPRRPLALPSLASGRLHAPERPGSANWSREPAIPFMQKTASRRHVLRGRDDSLAQLSATLDRVRGGDACAVVVTGRSWFQCYFVAVAARMITA
jgi:hypothetical protein